MVWGGISHRAKTDLVTVHGNVNAMRYGNENVQQALLPFLRQGQATIYQQDNSRVLHEKMDSHTNGCCS